VRKALEAKKYTITRSETSLIAKTRVELNEEKVAHQVLRLIDKLEDLDDVQNVYTNADFPEEFAASYE
jgi:transcriptional/translational regulatory protein YebC/TACO1